MTPKEIFKLISTSIIFTALLAICFTANTHKDYDSQEVIHYIKADESAPSSKSYMGTYKVTAYDLSYQSCEKMPDHPAYGITASGHSLKDHSRESAMAIAVDPRQIPLGSKVLLVFNGVRSKYTGVYTAVDTGGAITNNRIDVFFGDFKNNVSKEALQFGVTHAEVYVLN